MRKGPSLLLVSALLVGCATNAPVDTAPAVATEDGGEMSVASKMIHWPVNLVLDMYDVFDVNFGMGADAYPFGMHMQFTKMFRVGMFKTADLELFGLIHGLHEEGNFYTFDQAKGDYRLGGTFGAGFGASFNIDLYEVYDWMAGVVTFNLINPAGDHTTY